MAPGEQVRSQLVASGSPARRSCQREACFDHVQEWQRPTALVVIRHYPCAAISHCRKLHNGTT